MAPGGIGSDCSSSCWLFLGHPRVTDLRGKRSPRVALGVRCRAARRGRRANQQPTTRRCCTAVSCSSARGTATWRYGPSSTLCSPAPRSSTTKSATGAARRTAQSSHSVPTACTSTGQSRAACGRLGASSHAQSCASRTGPADFRQPNSAALCGLQAHMTGGLQANTMGGVRMGGMRGVRLSRAPVLPGARAADMPQGIERCPFQLHTVRSGLIAWVLSGADADAACCKRRLGVATARSPMPPRGWPSGLVAALRRALTPSRAHSAGCGAAVRLG